MNELVATVNKNNLTLTWDEPRDFHSEITFEWRDLLIHLKVDVETTISSRADTVTINANGETSRFGVGRASAGAGVIGRHPRIETDSSFLSISQGRNIVIVKDNVKEGNTSVIEDEFIFKIINIPSSYDFNDPEVLNNDIKDLKTTIKKNEVTLFESKDDRYDINSYAYFEGANLVVDYWRLDENYEDEYFITVSKIGLPILYKNFEIQNQNNAELLIVIFNMFKGEECFFSFKEYLTQNNVPFEYRVINNER